MSAGTAPWRWPISPRGVAGVGVLFAGMVLMACATPRRSSMPPPRPEPVKFVRFGASPPPPAAAKTTTALTPVTAAQRLEKAHHEARIRYADSVSMVHADEVSSRPTVAFETLETRIDMMKRLIKATDSSDPEFPELLFRLAELYLHRKDHLEYSSQSLSEQLRGARRHGKEMRSSPLEQRRRSLQQKARRSSEGAVKIYSAMLHMPSFAQHKRFEEVLFRQGTELAELGRTQPMQEVYGRLIDEFPDSAFIPRAHVSAAEHHVEAGRLSEARASYAKVLAEYPDSAEVPVAHEGLARCLLEQGREGQDGAYEQSIDHFARAIETSTRQPGPRASSLRRDARRGLAEAYAYHGDPHRAWPLFEHAGRGPGEHEDESRSMLEELAEGYFRAKKYEESSVVYRELMTRRADDPSACRWQWRIVLNSLAHDDLSRSGQEYARLRDLLDHLRRGGSSGAVRRCEDHVRDAERIIELGERPGGHPRSSQ